MTSAPALRISAVGDIAFEGPAADRPTRENFEGVLPCLLQSDLVVGNLECVLTCAGREGVAGKCTLRGDPAWAQVLRESGVGLVSLANNHAMDFGADGLFETMEALRQGGVGFVGAGRNRVEACAPVFLHKAQRRIAFLARSTVIVSSPTYATDNVPGVAYLDVDQTTEAIRACRPHADLVVLMVHWGIEEYSYPSLSQRQIARRLADAGADVILGHHPHVLQGIEYCGPSVVAYSLGNFIFDEFEWNYVLPDGAVSKLKSPLLPENKKGVITTIEWAGSEPPIVSQTYTKIEPHGRAFVDSDPARDAEMKALSAGIDRPWYRLWWQWYAIRREWSLRLQGEMSLWRLVTNLHRLRLRHLTGLVGALRRSARMVSEKSTNPYE